jgi:hypothetical protein
VAGTRRSLLLFPGAVLELPASFDSTSPAPVDLSTSRCWNSSCSRAPHDRPLVLDLVQLDLVLLDLVLLALSCLTLSCLTLSCLTLSSLIRLALLRNGRVGPLIEPKPLDPERRPRASQTVLSTALPPPSVSTSLCHRRSNSFLSLLASLAEP